MDKIPIPEMIFPVLKQYAKAAITVQPHDLLFWSYLYFKQSPQQVDHVSKGRLNFKPSKPKLAIVTESHLTPLLIKTLKLSLTNSDGFICVQDLYRYWVGHSMNTQHLKQLLNIVSVRDYEYISKTLFVTLACAHVSSNVRGTLYLICKLLNDDFMIHIDLFVKIYKYLAKLDMYKCDRVSAEQDQYLNSPIDRIRGLFPSRDYVHLHYEPSECTTASSVSTESYYSERKLMVWKEIVCKNTNERLPAKKVASNFGATSRDGLMQFQTDDSEGYIGILEYIETQIKPIKKSLEKIIFEKTFKHAEMRVDDRKTNSAPHQTREDFKRKMLNEEWKDNIENYEKQIQETFQRPLKILRQNFKDIVKFDENLQKIREIIAEQDLNSKEEINKKFEDIVRVIGYRETINECINNEDSNETCYEETSVVEQYLKPYLIRNINVINKMADNVPANHENKAAIKNSKDGLIKLIDFWSESESHSLLEGSRQEKIRKKSSEQTVISVEGLDTNSIDLHQDLASSSEGLRYCIPGIGATVPGHIIDEVVKHFQCMAMTQCGMITLSNISNVLCPPLN